MPGPSNAARYFDAIPYDIDAAAVLPIPVNAGYVRVKTGSSSTLVTSIASPKSGDHVIITAEGTGAIYFAHTAFSASSGEGTVCLNNAAACAVRAGDFLELKQNFETGQWIEVSRSIRSGGSVGGSVPTTRQSDVFAEEFVAGNYRHLRLTLLSTPLSVANTTGQSFGALKIYDFGTGFLKVESARLSASLAIGSASESTGLDTTAGGDFSVGSAPTLDVTLDGAEVNFIASTGADPLSGGILAQTTTAFTINGTSTASDIYLNGLLDDADVENASTDIVEFTGTLDVLYQYAGDI